MYVLPIDVISRSNASINRSHLGFFAVVLGSWPLPHTHLMFCFASILTASIGRSSDPVALSSPIFPSCSDASFSLNMSTGPSVNNPFSIGFRGLSLLSKPSTYFCHRNLTSLPSNAGFVAFTRMQFATTKFQIT